MTNSQNLIIHGMSACTCTYKNWRGETATRHLAMSSIWFGTTQWHPEPQWFLNALDIDTHEFRDFAMRDMTDVTYESL